MNKMKSEKGFSLIGTLVALALMGLTAAGVITGLSTTLKAGWISQERMVAESLAKSQWEHIRAQDYIPTVDYNPDDPESSYELIALPDDLMVKGYAIEIDPPQTITSSSDDYGIELQSINIVINRDSKLLLTLSDYRTGRLN